MPFVLDKFKSKNGASVSEALTETSLKTTLVYPTKRPYFTLILSLYYLKKVKSRLSLPCSHMPQIP